MKNKKIFVFCLLLVVLIGQHAVAQTSAEWEPKEGADDAAVSAVGLTPRSPGMAVVGYENGDLYMTLSGATGLHPYWMKVDEPTRSPALPDKMISSIAISPHDSKTYYVAFVGCKYTGNLWVTYNGGRSFFAVESGPSCNLTNVSINPVDSSIVYVTDNSGEVHTSYDYGTTWTTEAGQDPLTPPGATGRISAVSTAQDSFDHVIVGTNTGEVWLTENAQDENPSWTNITDESQQGWPDFPEKTVLSVIHVSGFDPPVFFVSFNQTMTTNSLWKYSVVDDQWSWSISQGGAINPYAAVGSVGFNPAFVNTVYATTTYVEYNAYKSDNLGDEWFDAAAASMCGIPPYSPSFWNDGGTIQRHNNCYNYANNHRTDTFAQPGKAAGAQYTSLTCDDVYAAAEADGLVSLAYDDCPASKTKVALVVAPGWDYHWYRLDSNGMWSHKPGRTEATDRDNSDNPIASPETADRGRYTDFCGYMCLCSDEEQGQGHEDIE